MESAFPRAGDRFDVVTISDDDVMQECIDQCVAEGWTSIADLYGVERKRGKLRPVRCSVPAGYGTIKAKSWLAQIVKGRPISPHTRHVMKRISNAVARGYHVVLLSINNERVTRMYTTQEYKYRVMEDQVRVRDELRRLTGDPTAQPGYVHDL